MTDDRTGNTTEVVRKVSSCATTAGQAGREQTAEEGRGFSELLFADLGYLLLKFDLDFKSTLSKFKSVCLKLGRRFDGVKVIRICIRALLIEGYFGHPDLIFTLRTGKSVNGTYRESAAHADEAKLIGLRSRETWGPESAVP